MDDEPTQSIMSRFWVLSLWATFFLRALGKKREDLVQVQVPLGAGQDWNFQYTERLQSPAVWLWRCSMAMTWEWVDWIDEWAVCSSMMKLTLAFNELINTLAMCVPYNNKFMGRTSLNSRWNHQLILMFVNLQFQFHLVGKFSFI